MWGMGGWTGSEDTESLGSLQRAIELGCNFFDSAWVYGDGHSEKLLGQEVKTNPPKKIYVASKVLPKNRTCPAPPKSTLDKGYSSKHLTVFVAKSFEHHDL